MSPQAERRATSGRFQPSPPGARKSGTADGERGKAGDGALKLGPSCFVETDRVGSAAYLTLIGELDMSCNDRFIGCLKEVVADYPEHLVIDLRSLTFIDSTGIALLLRARGLGQKRGFELHVVGSSADIVRAVFEAAGVAKFLTIIDEPPRLGA
jgi:anti-anti-sigma factor